MLQLKSKEKDLFTPFSEFLAVDCRCSPNSVRSQIWRIKKIQRFLNKNGLKFDKDGFRKFLVHLQSQHYLASTQRVYIFTIRNYNKFTGETWGKEIPLPKIEYRLPDILSIAEIEALIKSPRKSLPASSRSFYDLLLTTLSQTGCRIGEILNLKVEDLNLKDNTFTLRQTKTKEQRIIPISEKLTNELSQVVQNKDPTSLVFPSPSGSRLSNGAIWYEIKKRAREAGIQKRISPHTFRHSYITELLRHDVSILKVMRLVGHENLKTTQAYTHLIFEDLRSAAFRHPLVAKHRNPHDIITEIKEKVEAYGLRGDSRFFYELSVGGEGIRVSIFVR